MKKIEKIEINWNKILNDPILEKDAHAKLGAIIGKKLNEVIEVLNSIDK